MLLKFATVENRCLPTTCHMEPEVKVDDLALLSEEL